MINRAIDSLEQASALLDRCHACWEIELLQLGDDQRLQTALVLCLRQINTFAHGVPFAWQPGICVSWDGFSNFDEIQVQRIAF